MKRALILLTLGLIATSFVVPSSFRQVHAQGSNDVITLDDATPGIDVIINPAPGTTGAVAVQLDHASVTVTDQSGAIIFQMADPRVHGLEIRFAPEAGTHTLTAERLPGVSQAAVKVISQAELSYVGKGHMVSSSTIGNQQQRNVSLPVTSPNNRIGVNIPAGRTDAVTASFPGAPVAAQIADNRGVVLASLYGGKIDGVSLTLDSGVYSMSLANASTNQDTVANISLMPVSQQDLVAAMPSSSTNNTTSQNVTASQAQTCDVTVQANSINLRSGPGQGYSVLGYGFWGQSMQVGGTNTDGNWLLVASPYGSAWMEGQLGQLTGSCANLTTYDIPYRAAPSSQVFAQAPSGGEGEGFEREHEGREDD